MNAPGKASLAELMDAFPTEEKAVEWFEGLYWPKGRQCMHCGADRTRPVPNAKPMPYWCTSCRSYFSVKTGTAMADSKIPLRKWAIAIYLCLKRVSSMKLHRDLEVTQKTARFMLHRLREAWAQDETYMGGKRYNMSLSKRAEQEGRGPVGKTPVVGAKDRKTKEVPTLTIAHLDPEMLAKALWLPQEAKTDTAETPLVVIPNLKPVPVSPNYTPIRDVALLKRLLEYAADGVEFLSPLAVQELWEISGASVRKAIGAGNVEAPVELWLTDRPVSLICLESACAFWGEPDEEKVAEMRENDVDLFQAVGWKVLHPKPLIRMRDPEEVDQGELTGEVCV